MNGYCTTIPNENILLDTIILKEAKASSEIENIVTTNDNLYKSIVTEKAIDPNTKEVLNYRKALWKGVDLVKTNGFISTNIILEIQQILEDNKSGIRKIPGTALRNSLTGDVIYTPPAGESVIRNLLDNLERYYNIESEVDPL
ncbi:MAG: hypothetical protein J7L73_06320, partial [Anaerolineales bacterium]|nr:hypothetical protein [Anaerolineales bacterium]